MKKSGSLKILINITIISVAGMLFFISAQVNRVYAASTIDKGDFYQAFNNTTQDGTWRDPVHAKPGDVIEFKIKVHNSGTDVAKNVEVWGSIDGKLPGTPAKQLVITGQINNRSSDGALSKDTITIDIDGNTPVGMKYFPGQIRIKGKTSVFDCENVCMIPEDKINVLGGFLLGDVAPGATVEIAFKGALAITSLIQTPTPAPVGGVVNAASTATSSPKATSTPISSTTDDSTDELPRTGIPLAGLALTGLIPLGAGLKKFGRGEIGKNSAKTYWEYRELKK